MRGISPIVKIRQLLQAICVKDHEEHWAKHLADAIVLLTCELKEIRNDKHNAILQRLAQLENKIMTAIETYGQAVNTAFDKIGTAVDGVASDVKWLKDEILKLQNTPGPISASDQAILDGIQARAEAVVAKVEALDSLTVPPATPPTP